MKRSKAPSTPGSTPAGWGEQPLKPYSLLLPQGRQGTSLVVPDTPDNTPCSIVAKAGVTMVMETPDDLVEECGVTEDPGSGAGGSRDHTSDSLGSFKMRRRNIVSFLESDFSQKHHQKEVSSALSEDDRAGNELTPKERRQWAKVQPALGISRQRRSLANIILPFDLNDSDYLAAKLSHIQQEKIVRRRSHSTPRQVRASSATPEVPKRRDLKHISLSARVRRRGLSSSPGTPKRPGAEDRGRRKEGSTNTLAHDGNATIHFNNEDVQLTPVHHNRGLGLVEAAGQTTTPTRLAASGDTTMSEGATENNMKHLQTSKSPLLQLRRFNAAATQRMAKELSEGQQRSRRGEEDEAGEAGGECCTAPLPSTPQANSKNGSGTSTSPQKDPSSVLEGVVAYVEVRVERDNRSAVIREQLEALGAKVESRLTRNTTHVIFREGSKAIFLRAKERGLHILSALWVEACRISLTQAPESQYPSTSLETYSSDIHIPKRFRRQKSMQAKDFEEDMKLVEARLRRRHKKAATAAATAASTDSVPKGFCTPRHRLPREDINSPLYGISHLLSPHCKGSDVSTCEEEEEEENDICTPLAKRLIKRFMSRQVDGRRKGMTSEDAAEAGGSESSGSGAAFGPEGASDSLGEQEANLRLRLEDSDSLSRRTSSEVVNDSDASLPRRLSSEAMYNGESLPRRLTDEADDEREMILPRRLGSEGVGEDESLPGGLTNSTGVKEYESPVSVRNDSHLDEDGSPPGSPKRLTRKTEEVENGRTSLRSRAGGGGSSVESDSNQAPFIPDTPVIPKRRQSMRLMARFGEAERGLGRHHSPSADDEEGTKRRKSSNSPEKSNSRVLGDAGSSPKPSSSRTTSRKSITSAVRRGGTPTPGKSKVSVVGGRSEVGEAMIPASQLEFPSSQVNCSQRGRRRLMCLEEEIVPSQDLITPVTPNPEERRKGPYSLLLHPPPPKTRNRRYSQQLFTRRSPKTLPSGSSGPQKAESSSRGGTSGSASSEGQTESSSGSKGREVATSSGDDSVFAEPRIVMLPRPRRSTEEFKMEGGRPKPKRSTGRGRGKRRSCPPAQSSFLCLTSLHSSDKRTVVPIVRKLGGYRVGERVDQRTSHVVCGEQRRTLNLLLGIARGCWVLDVSWVYRSLEGDAWAPEEPYELSTFAPGAKVCRQQRQAQGSSYQHTLFSKVGGVCVMDGCSPPAAQLKELLELCGASVVSSIRSARVVVGGGTSSSARASWRSTLVTHVSEKWVLDSVQHHKVHPVQDYLLS